MSTRFLFGALLACFGLVTAPLSAQSFTVGGRTVHVHGFFSQGFVMSNHNNFATMNTNDGAVMTDGGLNVSLRLTSKLRVGAQAYARKYGDLGRGNVELDWGYGDYRFNDRIGLRVGKVKTVLGLYNDTQDTEFLHTWALLPQALYAIDQRSSNIAHTGADLYGSLPLRKGGDIAYTVYAGMRGAKPADGFTIGLKDIGYGMRDLRSTVRGADVRWNTPASGLLFGFSVATDRVGGNGMALAYGLPFRLEVPSLKTWAAYTEYSRDKLKLAAEARRFWGATEMRGLGQTGHLDNLGWFVSGAYRLHRRLEVGAYESRFIANAGRPAAPPSNHIYDTAVTARFDLKPWWIVKLEGHFMDGYSNPGDGFRSYYYRNNPPGALQPGNTMLVLRSGFNF